MRMHAGYCSDQNPMRGIRGWPWFTDDDPCSCTGHDVDDLPPEILAACNVLYKAKMRMLHKIRIQDHDIFEKAILALIILAYRESGNREGLL